MFFKLITAYFTINKLCGLYWSRPHYAPAPSKW